MGNGYRVWYTIPGILMPILLTMRLALSGRWWQGTWVLLQENSEHTDSALHLWGPSAVKTENGVKRGKAPWRAAPLVESDLEHWWVQSYDCGSRMISEVPQKPLHPFVHPFPLGKEIG